MTRGNQRELARAKNLKKQQDQAKADKKDELTPQQRRERDAKALAEKVKQKEAKSGDGNTKK